VGLLSKFIAALHFPFEVGVETLGEISLIHETGVKTEVLTLAV
jgi:hypothetical protein